MAPVIFLESFIRGLAVEALIDYYKIDVEKSDTKDERFVKNFPMHLVPGLLTEDGEALHEIIAVLFYLIDKLDAKDKRELLGAPEQLPSLLKWLSFANSELMPEAATIFKTLQGRAPYDKARFEKAQTKIESIIKVYEQQLTKTKFLLGDKVTLADYVTAVYAIRAFENFWGKEWAEAHPAITNWHKEVLAQPLLKDSKVVKSFKIIDKPLELKKA